MIFFTFISFNDFTANAIAVYVLPVPAGPVAKSKSFFWKHSTRIFWLAVRARIGLPLMLYRSTSLSSVILTELVSLPRISRTSSAPMRLYLPKNSSIAFSFISNTLISSLSPTTFITSPRCTIFRRGKFLTRSIRFSSRIPKNFCKSSISIRIVFSVIDNF